MRLSILLLLLAALDLPAADMTVRPDLVYSKSFGGSGSEYGTAVAVDPAGNVYVAGNTPSPDFPVKNGFQARIGGTPLRASTDGGKTWVSLPIPEGAQAVAGSPKAPGVLYAGTSRRMYKSGDGGKSWAAVASAPQTSIHTLIVDPGNPAVVYAATGSGVYKSVDAGGTWKLADRGGWNVVILAMNPSRPSTLLAGTAYGGPAEAPAVYRSTDAGATWVLLGNAPVGVFALAPDPSNPDAFYAAASPYAFAPGAIYKTSDGGGTWKQLTDAQVTVSTSSLAASSTAVYAGTTSSVIRSRDGGATWTATSTTFAVGNLAVDPDNPQIVYAAAGAVIVSTDGGTTWSTVLPVRQVVQSLAVVPGTPNAIFVGATSGQNIFVTKWSGDGKQMIYSTYLGGSYYDFATGIAVDRQGNAYVTGYTYGTDFPVTRGALQSKTAAVYAPLVAKISPDGATLAYSTYLGGSTGDAAFAIAVDGFGSAYLTGYAGSDDFPVTPGALQSRIGRNCPSLSKGSPSVGDAFVAKLNADGSALAYSTFLGGGCNDEGFGIALDSAGAAYVVGATTSTDFPATKGALQPTSASKTNKGFLAKLTPQGGSLTLASFIGGDGGDTAGAVALDAKGNLYISGCTAGFDATAPSGGPASVGVGGPGLPRAGFGAGCWGLPYVLKLNAAGSAKIYLTYIYGFYGAGGSIAVDEHGYAWVAGSASPFGPMGQEFPSVHPFQAKTGQGFVGELSADGSDLLFCSRVDSAYGMSLDIAGNAYLTGFASSLDKESAAAFVARIDGAVPSAITVEEPQRLPPGEFLRSDSGVAPGQILILTGTGLGPLQEAGAQIGPDGRVASVLAGTSVTFDGAPAPLISVQAGRVVCIVPFGAGSRGDYTTIMQVHNNGVVSNSIRLRTAPTAIELLAVTNQDGTVNSPEQPAKPGSVITIYLAGVGRTDSSVADGQVNGSGLPALQGANVWLGEIAGDILYAGPAPGQVAGVMQINVRVPDLDPDQYRVVVDVNGDGDVIDLSVGK